MENKENDLSEKKTEKNGGTVQLVSVQGDRNPLDDDNNTCEQSFMCKINVCVWHVCQQPAEKGLSDSTVNTWTTVQDVH